MPAPFLATLVLAVVITFDLTVRNVIHTFTTHTGTPGAASNVARTKVEDTHDKKIRAFPTLKLQQETSMAETLYTSSKIIMKYQNV